MPNASVVYWYSGDKMRLDGGGIRVKAWETALTQMGYRVYVSGLWSIGGGVAKGSRVSASKRAVIPMPFTRKLPEEAREADLVVATVPATFGSALSSIPTDRLVLDWMDLWSVASRNLGDARWSSRLGGRIQAKIWQRRERAWTGHGQVNVYAGHEDLKTMQPYSTGRSAWIPTPVEHRGRPQTGRAATRRLGFIGNLDYPPNQKSLRAFLAAHGGSVQAQGWQIVVAGFGSTQVAGWGYPVSVLGEIADIADFYREIDAAVVPINHGGGIKVKAVEALSFGVPVLTTDHVRSGFDQLFHPFLPDLAVAVRHLDLLQSRTVPRDVFDRRFSPQAFLRDVKKTLSLPASD